MNQSATTSPAPSAAVRQAFEGFAPTTCRNWDAGNGDAIVATGGAGDIKARALESSTVDLAEEFSNLIMTQRAYSASSKIITTADEMLDELIRLKR